MPLIADQFWDDIPINYTPIPYDDLSANGSYGRTLNLAEDVPPTLSVLSATEYQGNGGKVQHLAACDSTGHLLTAPSGGVEKVEVLLSDGTPVDSTHPFPVTSSGSSAGPSPQIMTSLDRSGYNVGGVGGPVSLGGAIPGTLSVLYGFSCAWYYNFTPGNAIPLGNLQFYISDSGETTVVHLCRFGVSRNNFTADDGPPWITGEEQTVMFPVPIDGASWTTQTGLLIRANGDLANVNVSATIWYKKT